MCDIKQKAICGGVIINHLHVHSQYSTLDGLSTVKDIVARAKELGARSVAITDHASISSLPELMKEAKEAGIKPVVGCEFYVVDKYAEGEMKDVPRLHLCVWAKSWAGVISIMSKLSLANRQFYRRPLLTVEQATGFVDCMVGTACCFGVLSSDRYVDHFATLHKVYGEDLYVELMPHIVALKGEKDLQKTVNIRGIELARKHGVKLLATNDSHYTLQDDAGLHKVMMATQYNKRLSDYEGESWPPVFYMRSIPEMYESFVDLGYIEMEDIKEAMRTTVQMDRKVDIQMPVFDVNLPRIHKDEERALMDACLDGWAKKIKRKVGDKYNEYRKRLVYELEVIKGLKFIPYFLMVADIIQWARSQGIVVGPARGSSAGSLVCYLMDITRVDPIRHGLYFERFLNPERNDLPDIDVDFQDDRRSEVLAYIVKRYGRDKVGQISTFNQMAIKGAFRDVSRAYGVDMAKINSLSTQLEEVEDFETVPDLVAFAGRFPQVVEDAKRLEGTIRGVGQHACGVIISSEPLESVCAIERRKGDSMATCWDKDQCEKFGLVKMDVLGLTTLSILDMATKLVEKYHGKRVVLEDIRLDDPDVLKAFSRGDGNCVFQFESHGMQELLRSLDIKGFQTIADCTALYRPGPLSAGLTDRYAKVSKGDEYPRYSIPELEPILSSTNSVLVYQEQIMRVFNELAGFTWSEADKMRKIIGKKLGEDAFDEHRGHFVSGCKRNGIPEKAASALFDEMRGFASYSFNLSHAVAYTMISFYSMWFKVKYPAIFLSAYITCVKSDDAVIKGMTEARRLGITVESPDVNTSTSVYEYDHTEGRIIAPLSVIKGVGDKAADEILKARGDMAFLSLEDFNDRVYKRVVNKRVVENLKLAGAFGTLGIVEHDTEAREKAEAELMPTFDAMPTLSLKRSKPVNRGEIEQNKSEIERYYEGKAKPLLPVIGASPLVMIINSPMKNEATLGTGKGTAYIYGLLKTAGLDKRFVAYTSLVKCMLPDPKKIPTEDRIVGESWLRKEIKAVAPKLIYCCDANALSMFFTGDKLSKVYGRVRYSKEFEAYIMTGPSPQHAAYRPDDVQAQFNACMGKIAKMFEIGGGDDEV